MRWSDDAPVQIAAPVEQLVQIDRHVGAVEIANAEMQDPGPDVLATINGQGCPVADVCQSCKREFGRHGCIPWLGQ
jgi:hypothetical protein